VAVEVAVDVAVDVAVWVAVDVGVPVAVPVGVVVEPVPQVQADTRASAITRRPSTIAQYLLFMFSFSSWI